MQWLSRTWIYETPILERQNQEGYKGAQDQVNWSVLEHNSSVLQELEHGGYTVGSWGASQSR